MVIYKNLKIQDDRAITNKNANDIYTRFCRYLNKKIINVRANTKYLVKTTPKKLKTKKIKIRHHDWKNIKKIAIKHSRFKKKTSSPIMMNKKPHLKKTTQARAASTKKLVKKKYSSKYTTKKRLNISNLRNQYINWKNMSAKKYVIVKNIKNQQTLKKKY